MNRLAGLESVPVACFVSLVLAVPYSAARDHHVATSGDNAGNGSLASPFLTINRALQKAEPGDVIVIHAGVYNEQVRILLPGITLRAADGESASIRAPLGTGDSPGRCVMFDVDASGGRLQGLELIGGYYTVFLQSRWDWGGPDRGGASDILIEDCTIRGSGRDCIKITPNCDRITIRRCEISDSGQLYPPGTPFEDKNAEGIDSTNGDAVVVQDCYVHDIATTGIYFKGGAADCVVERTRVARCGQAGILLGFDTSPEFFDLAANPRYYECIRGTVRNCIVEETDYAGIGFYALNDGLAANNTLINTARVAHSAIYFGVTIQDYDPNAGRPASQDVRVVNNIVAQLQPSGSPVVSIRYLFEPELGKLAGLEGMPEMSNNLYYDAGGAPRFGDARPQSILNAGDLVAWQAHISGDANSLVADPVLNDSGHLTGGSPALGRGIALTSVTNDFDGEPRTAAVDIGADQLTSRAAGETGPGEAPDEPDADGNGTPEPKAGSDRGGDDSGEGADLNSDAEDRGNTHGAQSVGRDDRSREDSGGDARHLPLPPTAGVCPLAAAATLMLSLAGLQRSGRDWRGGPAR